MTGRMDARPLENDSAAGSDKSTYLTLAPGTSLERLCGHVLKLLKMMATAWAFILIGWHISLLDLQPLRSRFPHSSPASEFGRFASVFGYT